MRNRNSVRVVLVILFAYAALSVALGAFVAEATLHPGRRPLLPGDEIQGQTVAQRYNSDLTNVLITASEGTTLRGWYFHPRGNNKRIVMLLHGLSDNRLGMIGYAEILLRRGFGVLLPDARGHGASGGGVVTYGLLESADIHTWTRWIDENQHPNCIFALGESMGAAQLLQSLDADSEFCAVVAESPFSSFREIAYDRVGQFFRTGPWLGRTLLRPVIEAAFLYARWKYKLNFEQLSPEKMVATTNVPVLLIHGSNDSKTPIRHSRRIRAENSNVSFWEVPDAEHCGAISTVPQQFEERLISWFDGHSGGKHLLPGHLAQKAAIALPLGPA